MNRRDGRAMVSAEVWLYRPQIPSPKESREVKFSSSITLRFSDDDQV
jgi:hypothetical protein